MRFIPNDNDKARLIQKFGTHNEKRIKKRNDQRSRQRSLSIRSTGYCFLFLIMLNVYYLFIYFRSGYAFSQQKGWGPRITSGTLRTKSANRRRPVEKNLEE